MGNRQLILGAAIEMGRAGCRHFVESLMATGYRQDLALLVDVAESTEWFDAQGIVCVPIDQAEFDVRATTRLRFLAYQRLLRKFASDYDYVMFTDVRDVVFQRDPFDFALGSGMHCFLESTTHEDCKVNTTWASQLCSRELAAQLRPHKVSCAGTTLGCTRSMLRYAELINETVEAMGPAALRHVSDQTAHNVLLHTGAIDAVQHENLAGPVATLGHVRDEDLRFDKEGQLLNRDGSVVHVIHQYDRKPLLQALLHARFESQRQDALLTMH